MWYRPHFELFFDIWLVSVDIGVNRDRAEAHIEDFVYLRVGFFGGRRKFKCALYRPGWVFSGSYNDLKAKYDASLESNRRLNAEVVRLRNLLTAISAVNDIMLEIKDIKSHLGIDKPVTPE